METKADIAKESLNRVMKMQKGDPVTNICAGEKNPLRLAYFVGIVIKQYRNKYGYMVTDRWARCTDKKGHVWNTGIDVIYPGHIDYEEACRIFDPIHAIWFPECKPQVSQPT